MGRISHDRSKLWASDGGLLRSAPGYFDMSIQTGERKERETATSVSVEVMEEVAKQTETDQLDLPPLADSIDPDALNSLFASPRAVDRQTGQIEFTYYGHLVTVSFDGSRTVTVTEELAP